MYAELSRTGSIPNLTSKVTPEHLTRHVNWFMLPQKAFSVLRVHDREMALFMKRQMFETRLITMDPVLAYEFLLLHSLLLLCLINMIRK